MKTNMITVLPLALLLACAQSTNTLRHGKVASQASRYVGVYVLEGGCEEKRHLNCTINLCAYSKDPFPYSGWEICADAEYRAIATEAGEESYGCWKSTKEGIVEAWFAGSFGKTLHLESKGQLLIGLETPYQSSDTRHKACKVTLRRVSQ